MEMDRRQFAVFILSVLYGPLLVSRMQESYKLESPNKPQPVGLQVSASAGIPTVDARLAAVGDTEIGGDVTPPTVQRKLIET